MLLEAQKVSKAFGAFRAVSDADIAVDDHEIVGLIGPNGAGKSTFFNCLAGDMAPTTGRIVFAGQNVTRASPEVHARLGIGRTFQVPATFEDMTVLDNVMVGAFLRHPHRGDALARSAGSRRADRPQAARRPARPFARHARPQAAGDRARACHRAAPDAARRIAGRSYPDRVAGGDRAWCGAFTTWASRS